MVNDTSASRSTSTSDDSFQKPKFQKLMKFGDFP